MVIDVVEVVAFVADDVDSNVDVLEDTACKDFAPLDEAHVADYELDDIALDVVGVDEVAAVEKGDVVVAADGRKQGGRHVVGDDEVGVEVAPFDSGLDAVEADVAALDAVVADAVDAVVVDVAVARE